jgi:hypothetical protein
MTRDIDLVVAVEPHEAEKLAAAFQPDYYVPAELATSIRDRAMFNLLHLASVIKVDMVVRKDEPYRRAEFQRRQRVSLPGFETWIAAKEDLILSNYETKDTTPEVEKMVPERYLAMTPVERFLIGVQMFETARSMALASFPREISAEEIRRRLCERFYGALAREAFGERA